MKRKEMSEPDRLSCFIKSFDRPKIGNWN